jgi:cytochrome c556
LKRLTVAFGAVLFSALAAATLVSPSTGQSTADSGAQTALTTPVETTLGRRLLMLAIGSNNDMLHDILDGVLPMDELEMRGRLDTMSAMFYAFPSLYRELPNPYTEEGAAADAARVSLATEAVWANFETFKQLAYDAYVVSKHAADGPTEEIKAKVEELEVMCESCHATYRQSFEDFENLENSIK